MFWASGFMTSNTDCFDWSVTSNSVVWSAVLAISSFFLGKFDARDKMRFRRTWLYCKIFVWNWFNFHWQNFTAFDRQNFVDVLFILYLTLQCQLKPRVNAYNQLDFYRLGINIVVIIKVFIKIQIEEVRLSLTIFCCFTDLLYCISYTEIIEILRYN